MSPIHQVLDVARWAPSGDNTQPWRFQIRSETSALIHGYDTRHHCVYDLDGWASQLAHGALLENVALAATRFGHRAQIALPSEREDGVVAYGVVLQPAFGITEDPLVRFIPERTVQRRAMRPVPLSDQQRHALEQSVEGFRLVMFEPLPDRWKLAALNARNAHIRLTIPEAYAVHKEVIAWHEQTSVDRLPDASLGAGPVLLGTMRFAMASFERVDFLNRFAGGTWLPRLALDFIPGILCAAHFALVAPRAPRAMLDRVEAGRAVQRLWLTATGLGLQLQPSYTPLVFARYAREDRLFTGSASARATATEIARRLDQLLGADAAARTTFLGRLGPARITTARSLRRPLAQLIVDAPPRELPRV
jgi:hypothetical protein